MKYLVATMLEIHIRPYTLKKVDGPEVLQKLLGHSNFKQTMKYVKIVEKAVIKDYLRTEKKAKVLPLNNWHTASKLRGLEILELERILWF
jgi:hypothetical protein